MKRFTWECFDATFLKEVLRVSDNGDGFSQQVERAGDDIDELVCLMNMVCEYPDERFVMKYRTIIERHLLLCYPELVKKVCKVLGIRGRSFNEKQSKLTRHKTSKSLVSAYINAILSISGISAVINEYSRFRYTVALNMPETKAEEVPLYDFQKEAVADLKEHFIEKDNKRGMLIMPTGSGKSRTATCFLIREMISRGYQILWIAHRHMLIEQAAECFYKFSGLAKLENPKIRDYRISCASGEHLSLRSIGKDEIIVASVQSLYRNKEHLKRILGNKVMLVIDEAHHALAPTYRDIINLVMKKKNSKLLGLTATPVRGNVSESSYLTRIFDDNIVYSVSMSRLISKGILSTPVFERVETGEEFEPVISDAERSLIKRFGELPETLVNKIAVSKQRNAVILNEYLKNRDKYGKTLMFAMNIVHCRLLCEELVKAGVRADMIYSGREDNAYVINDFREDKLDVLVNVNIMTEGSDVPNIETVFLTRPTQSEGLLMQMIGRGMRGVFAGGTETVHIVDFHDKWETFNKWLNPEWTIGGEIYDEDDAPHEYKVYETQEYGWDLCKDIYNSFVIKAVEAQNKTVSVPVGWYTLVDEDGELYCLLIFEDQLKGFKEMARDRVQWGDDPAIVPKVLLDKYFSYFCSRPSERDMEVYINTVRSLTEHVQISLIKNRKYVDPAYVLEKADKEGKDIFIAASETYDEYDVAKDLYTSKEKYIEAVCRAKIYKNTQVIGSAVKELEIELIPFDRTPCYDLDELTHEVKEEMFGGEYEGISSVTWTDRPYKTYYGMYYSGDGSIKINSLLNSKDVPREVIKYLIYHEMLHRDYRYHDRAFREKEHKYPNYAELDYFLDGQMSKFDIEEW